MPDQNIDRTRLTEFVGLLSFAQMVSRRFVQVGSDFTIGRDTNLIWAQPAGTGLSALRRSKLKPQTLAHCVPTAVPSVAPVTVTNPSVRWGSIRHGKSLFAAHPVPTDSGPQGVSVR